MTARQKLSLTLTGGGLVALFSAGVSWGTSSSQLSGKEDAQTHAADVASLRQEQAQALGQIRARITADSIRRESDREILERVDRRVRAMYCADKPPGCE